ncbi:MAG: pyridoxamine 5'-phosphate oxidase [Bacteroidota bacterium]|nr:pyridoxamine 5'-phosphate oxidase [Bacteroidota bacterium]
MDLHNIRESYNFDSLEEAKIDSNPMVQFSNWFSQYKALGIKDYNAMAISTIRNNEPDCRIVLLKEITDYGLVFYTNYKSVKGKSLSENPNISALFFWREHERQVRINGVVSKLSIKESSTYFKKRPYLSQIGAAASNQSDYIDSRTALENKFEKFRQDFPEGTEVPMPTDWGGYLIKPLRFEFWQGREGRLHDRIVFTSDQNCWNIHRIQP